MQSGRSLALKWLARREYSAQALRDKLAAHGCQSSEIEVVLKQCQQQGWQSDERFALASMRQAYHKGQGLKKVRYVLQQEHGLTSACLTQVEATLDFNWTALARTQLQKKFRQQSTADRKVQQKMFRFLQYRGFETETIHDVLATYQAPVFD
ncbi:MAG: regulatory protein RecX [Shewanellaceae bacterium]|nr:regulatory protein RecX [Shewanellaceae bacterium]